MPGFQRTAFDVFIEDQVLATNGKMFYARLAGTVHHNSDGSSRQTAIANLRSQQELVLEHEPGNEYDKNAVRVLTATGEQVGYLESRLAGETVRRTAKGLTTRAFVSNITGGRNGQPLGCTLGMLTYTAA